VDRLAADFDFFALEVDDVTDEPLVARLEFDRDALPGS